jgi:hypothetical protein
MNVRHFREIKEALQDVEEACLYRNSVKKELGFFDGRCNT